MKIAERSKLEDDDEEGQKKPNEQIKAYSKLYDQVDKSGFYSMISKHLKTILYDKDFYTILDTNIYEIVFKNGIYDLRTKEFKEGFNDYNYLTSTFDFDYTKPSQEDMDYVKNEVLFKICNANLSHLEYYLRVLGQSLTGDAEMEKALYFMVGIGGNKICFRLQCSTNFFLFFFFAEELLMVDRYENFYRNRFVPEVQTGFNRFHFRFFCHGGALDKKSESGSCNTEL